MNARVAGTSPLEKGKAAEREGKEEPRERGATRRGNGERNERQIMGRKKPSLFYLRRFCPRCGVPPTRCSNGVPLKF